MRVIIKKKVVVVGSWVEALNVVQQALVFKGSFLGGLSWVASLAFLPGPVKVSSKHRVFSL